MLTTGSQAPTFELPDQNGNLVALDELRDHWVLLWWYPKAATRG